MTGHGVEFPEIPVDLEGVNGVLLMDDGWHNVEGGIHAGTVRYREGTVDMAGGPAMCFRSSTAGAQIVVRTDRVSAVRLTEPAA